MGRDQLSLEDFAETVKREKPSASQETASQNTKEIPNQDPQILSVSDLNKMVRSTLESQFGLVWVKGEISNFKPHSSGHFYFSLKDETSQINAVMFKGFNQRLKFRPENGMEVVIRGRVTVYEPRGTYQVFCEIMEPVGLGALQMAFEQLKAKLKSEGLFDSSRKRPLPFMPKRLVLVTSPTGAAIRDMLNILSRRARGLEIILIPAVVQGAQAPQDIVKAIGEAQKIKDVDVMIVGRGGGSMEDLWAFNDEAVARAIASSKIPVISAVGHEIDFTIADFVADLRAPTPSAAAELVVKNTSDLVEKIALLRAQLQTLVLKKLDLENKHLVSLKRGLVDPKRRIQDLIIRSDELLQRLDLAMGHFLEDKKQSVILLRSRLGHPSEKLKSAQQRLEFLYQKLQTFFESTLESQKNEVQRFADILDSLSPLKVVARGYSIVSKEKQIIKASTQIKKDDVIHIKFAKGEATASVLATKKES